MSKFLKTIKHLLLVLFLLFSIFNFSPKEVLAENSVKGYFFYGIGCPHCEKADVFLKILETKYPSFSVEKYEVYFNRENAFLLDKISNFLTGKTIISVPFLIIGEQYFIGYADGASEKGIEEQLKKCLKNNCVDLFAVLSKEGKAGFISQESNNIATDLETRSAYDILNEENFLLDENVLNGNIDKNFQPSTIRKKIIDLPFLGEIDAMSLSLPVLTVVMGLLDGFNPCAMWTLLFLISLLIGMNDRKRMWILGFAFIFASAFVYFIFMAAWLNLILILGFVFWVRSAIGTLSIVGGIYNLKKFFREKNGTCEIVEVERSQKVFDNLKKVVKEKNFWLALSGIILLAFVVNLVELVCSAGLPAIYTQVLAMNSLASWQYYGYITLYIFFFMLDDLFVFVVAMWTLKMTGITNKYARYSHLIGGILMLIIGFLLVFFPSVLMFG